eukprot:PhM_4_TR13267/c0_g1_i1/m.48545/K03320/amt, AMT, MEP; ammonium transporter, Amt family
MLPSSVQLGANTTSTCVSQDADTAWMLMATVLVLSMFPGVAFFESGLLRKKNTTSILAQVFCGLTVLSIMWFVFGFSLSLGSDVLNAGMIGDLRYALFIGVHFDDCFEGGTIPTALYALFQMMFACITPLLMTGAYAERLAWKPFLYFTVAWEVLVYYPVCHWMWSSNGWLTQLGAQDFAGGIVIHATAGTSSLVAVALLGRRHNFHKYHGEFPYSSLTTASVGATLLWTGWFGFNGGSALGANKTAVAAVVNSQIGATACAATYMGIIALKTKNPSTIAMLNGAIGGLAGVTPASGFIQPVYALLLGFLLGITIERGIYILKHRLRFDDALDVSSVHGLTGIVGSLFIGLAANRNVNPNGADGLFNGGGWRLLGVQVLAVIVCSAWAGLWTYVILKIISRSMPLRVHRTHEYQGLDISIFREAVENRSRVWSDEEHPTDGDSTHDDDGGSVSSNDELERDPLRPPEVLIPAPDLFAASIAAMDGPGGNPVLNALVEEVVRRRSTNRSHHRKASSQVQRDGLDD